MPTAPKPELSRVPLCPHGVVAAAELAARGLGPVLDFSVNANPLGQPPGVAEAAAQAAGDRYPEDGAPRLRAAIAARLGVEQAQVLAGNGSIEIIWLLCAAYLRAGDAVVVVGPTFGEYVRAAAIHGAKPVEYRARAVDGFAPDLAAIVRLVTSTRPRLVFLCNPNNPTGLYLRREEVQRLRRVCREGLLVVDEAYLSFVEEPDSLLDLVDEGLVLVRSLTKDYNLAGLRLGFAVAHPGVVAALETVRPPWSVNAPAQAAGLVALADREHLDLSRRAAREIKAYLSASLSRLGLEVLPGAANFLMVRVGDAAGFRAAMLAKGIAVRDCTSFGLPEYVRIGLRPLPDCRRLVAAAREVLSGG